MATTTTKLGLVKPAAEDLVDIAVLNANSDKIDTASGAFICTSTTRPASPFNGQIIFESDTQNQYIRVAATSSWVRLGGTPIGAVMPVATLTAPSGWLLCDGTVHPNGSYPELAAAIGNTYGGSSGVSFAVPDLTGRVVVGKAASGTFAAVNNSGGSENVTLTEAQMPSHTHSDSGHAHAQQYPSGSGGYTYFGGMDNTIHTYPNTGWAFATVYTQGASANIQPTGGGQGHPNLQPYRVLNYAIKF